MHRVNRYNNRRRMAQIVGRDKHLRVIHRMTSRQIIVQLAQILPGGDHILWGMTIKRGDTDKYDVNSGIHRSNQIGQLSANMIPDVPGFNYIFDFGPLGFVRSSNSHHFALGFISGFINRGLRNRINSNINEIET